MPRKLPKLRTDLIITRQKQRGEVVFVIKDPDTREYFRYSEMEYQVMALFDGHHTMDQIIQDFKKIDTEVELDNETLNSFFASVKQNGLIERASSEKNLILLEKQRTFRKHRLLKAKGSPLYTRIPLIDPNKLLDKTIDFVRFFWTPWFFVVSLMSILASYAIIALNWDQVYQSLKEMYSFSNQSMENLLRLWIVIIVIIALHEFGHAYTCKNYGGEVHEMGFLLMMMINPCLYANVNDAWTFPEKSHKMWVTFAGGYFEAFIGSLATFAWWLTNPGTTFNTYCYTALTICSVSSLAFNFNPLVKLDGYYALSDYLEIPNLRQRAGDYVMYLLKRYIFRRQVETEEDEKKTKRVLTVYGILSKIWITTVLLTVFFMFRDLLISSLHEIGIIVIAGLLGYLFRRKLLKLGKALWKFFIVPSGQESAKKRRNRISVAIIVLFILGFFVPKDIYVIADCHLVPSERVAVRAQVDGFVKTVHVDEGFQVKQGQTLFSLEDPYQETELTRISLDRQITDIEIQREQSESNPAGIQEKLIRKNRLEQTLKTTQQFVAALIVQAPISGTILTPNISELNNAYIKKGTELCEMANLSRMHVVIPVRESDAGLVDIGDPVQVRVLAFQGRSFDGQVISMSAQTDTTKVENTIRVRLEIENEEGLLRTGMQGKSRIRAHQESWNAFLLRFLLRTIRMDLWF